MHETFIVFGFQENVHVSLFYDIDIDICFTAFKKFKK